MKLRGIAGIVTICAILLAAICACSGSATTSGGVGYVTSGAAGAIDQRTSSLGRQTLSGAHREITAGTCGPTPGPDNFVGGKEANSAPGYAAGVLSGGSNSACDEGSAVVAGFDNEVSSGTGNGANGSIIGGGFSNVIAGSPSGSSFIGAGKSNGIAAEYAVIGGGDGNVVSAEYGVVGGGLTNGVASGATDSFVGAGNDNAIGSGAYNAVIGGGGGNTVLNDYSTIIAGGLENKVSNGIGTIGGGEQNTISGLDGFIGGGGYNVVSAEYGSTGGGFRDLAEGNYATVAGGAKNVAGGADATVPGGGGNSAGGFASFAAGYFADASQSGSFVWADASSTSQTKSTAANQFLARASGGVKFFSNSGLTTGVELAPGSGTWASVSDRALKTRVEPIDDAAFLQRVAALPVTRWSYTSEGSVRHVGPMAQDFYAAFGLGEDDKHITSIDEDGVALAAIKALHNENQIMKANLRREDAVVRDLQHAKLKQDAAIHDLRIEIQNLSTEVAAAKTR